MTGSGNNGDDSVYCDILRCLGRVKSKYLRCEWKVVV